MAGRNLLRTPEGAWYNDYAEFKAKKQYRQHHHDFTPHGLEQHDKGHNYGCGVTEQDRNGALYEYYRAEDGPYFKADNREETKRRHWDVPPWEPPEGFSPRKTTTYEPSAFQQQSQESPKRIYPWDREAEGRGSPVLDRSYHHKPPDHVFASGWDPRMTKMAAPTSIESKEAGGALLFIRYPYSGGENYNIVAHACLHAITSDLHGQFFGIAEKVYDYGHSSNVVGGCAVFQFPSLQKAEIFYRRDKRLRQPDFPQPSGYAEVFAIAVKKDPNIMQTYDTLLLSEISLNDGLGESSLQCYIDNFKTPFTQLLERPEFKALPYAAFCTDTKADIMTIRRHYFSSETLVTLHLFKRPEDLENVMRHPEYAQLRTLHNSMATEKCSIFTVNRNPCP